jgi:hypothetical protein
MNRAIINLCIYWYWELIFERDQSFKNPYYPWNQCLMLFFCFNSTSSSSGVSSYTAASIAMWTSWWCSFRSCFSFVQSSEHTSSAAQSKAGFHAHTRRSQKHKKYWYYTCLSVCPPRTPNYSIVDLSEQTKQSSKSFKDSSLNRRKQKFLYFEICSVYRSSQRTL